MDAERTCRDTFQTCFGGVPEGIWSAPGRVNLIGEHTDYNDGLALPIALPQRTFVAAARRPDRRVRVHSVQTGEEVDVALDDIAPGRYDGWSTYVIGVPWALAEAGYAVGGADLVVDGRVPLGAGLSSSAALECAVAAALADLYDLRLNGVGLLDSAAGRQVLAQICRQAENQIAGAPTGGMDQAASLLATQGHALLLDCRDFATEQVPCDLAAAGLELLVIDTRAEHSLIDGQYGARRASCERAAATLGVRSLREVSLAELDEALDQLRRASPPSAAKDDAGTPQSESPEVVARRVRHVLTEIARVQDAVAALRDGDWPGLGALFTASHASLRDDYEVSCAELDVACAAAESAGALGARMTGGGFGGSAIALVPADQQDAIAQTARDAFAAHDFTAPDIFAVLPGSGAARDR